jgi:uncharacterized repeat protein (TIGR01451 family)
MLFFQQPPAPETVSTFATSGANCTTTGKTDFTLGDRVCAKLDGVPAGITNRRLVLVNPDGFVIDGVAATSASQSQVFNLPTAATDTLDGVPIDNRGSWIIASVDSVDATIKALAVIVVHSAQPVVDLQISKTPIGSNQAVAGQNISFLISVFNQGPDTAQNPHVIDTTPANTTFVSFTQNSVSPFTCTTAAGTTDCTKATLARYEQATFTVVYQVNTTIPDGTDLTTTTNASSGTPERRTTDNNTNTTTSASNPTPPSCTIACPANITQDNDPGKAGAIVSFNDPSTTGTCTGVTVDHPSGTFFPIGTTTVTATASDGTTSCSFNVTVKDTRTVTINLIGARDMTVECKTGFSDPGASASDSNGTISYSTTVTVPSGQVDSNGDSIPTTVTGVDPNTPNIYTITYTATSNGSTASATRTVHVVDSAPPDISIAGSAGFTQQTAQVTVRNDDGTTSTVTETIFVTNVECHSSFTPPAATATDSCDAHTVPVTVSGAVDPNTPPGDYDLIYSATDASGNDTNRILRVHVADTTAPTVTAPSAVTLNTSASGASCSVTVVDLDATLGTATTSDSCSSNVTLTRSGVPAGNVFPLGTTTITYTATDASGNHSSATQAVTVVDNTPPTITAPAPVTVNADAGSCSAANVVLGTPQTADNCSVASVTNDAPSTFPLGTTVVTWTVKDASNNPATATQAVTVIDSTPPTISAPPAVTVSTGAGSSSCDAFVDNNTLGTASASDSCAGSVTVTRNHTGNTFPVGTTDVTWTATDAAGNTATAHQSVTVIDNTAPVVTAPLNVTASTDANSCSATLNPGTATATDNCTAGVSTPVGTRNDNLPLSAPYPKGTTTITWTATDGHNNSGSATQTVTVNDTVKPTITAPSAVTVNADPITCTATGVALGTPITGDNCSVASVINNAPSTFPLGTTSVTWTVTDGSGNTATATQAVTVVDRTPPVITVAGANPMTIILGSAFSDPGATATDSCAGAISVTATSNVNTNAVGTYTVTYRATDPSGNTQTATRTVKVIYNFTGFFSPVANLPTLNVVNAGRAIPVKFSLSGNQGLGIFAANSPSSGLVTCGSNAQSDVTDTTTAGSSSLSYDAGSSQYNYVWKTDSSWAGQCRVLNLTLIDGTTHTALFKFR